MQQAKGPTEQVNYTGTRKPSKSEQNWGQGQSSQSKSEQNWGQGQSSQSKPEQNWAQGQSSRQGKTDICQYCAGPSHPRSICPVSNKRCSKKGCGRIGHFARACRMGAPAFAKPLEPVKTKHQACHLDASLNEEYETDLFEVEVKPEMYAQSVYSTAEDPHGTRVGRKFFSHLKLGVTKDMTKSIRTLPPLATHCQKILPSH